MEIICINDIFTPRQKSVIPNRPVVDKIYTIREVFNTEFGVAVYLNEIHNPPVDGGTMGTTSFTFEPSFNIERFASLLGRPLNAEQLLKEFSKNKVKPDINIDIL